MFYVYEYQREDGSPYYIGKGTKNRINEKHTVNLPPLERRVILKTDLSEQEAFDLEIELIKKYGRKDLGTGILRNRTNGGEGGSGRIFQHSEDSKRKISEAHKGKPSSWKGRSPSPESREKMRLAKLGKKQDPEVAKARGAAISRAKKGVPFSDAHKKALSDAAKRRYAK